MHCWYISFYKCLKLSPQSTHISVYEISVGKCSMWHLSIPEIIDSSSASKACSWFLILRCIEKLGLDGIQDSIRFFRFFLLNKFVNNDPDQIWIIIIIIFNMAKSTDTEYRTRVTMRWYHQIICTHMIGHRFSDLLRVTDLNHQLLPNMVPKHDPSKFNFFFFFHFVYWSFLHITTIACIIWELQ